jgi:hypothetical protein
MHFCAGRQVAAPTAGFLISDRFSEVMRGEKQIANRGFVRNHENLREIERFKILF